MFRRFDKRVLAPNDDGTGGGGGDGDKNNNPDSGNQGGGGSGDQNQNKDNKDFDALPDWAKKELKDLRSESAKRRTENKSLSERLSKLESGLKSVIGGDGDDKLTPEQKPEAMTGEMGTLQVRNAILNIAVQNGIPSDNLDFFEFQMNKAFNDLKEGEEISEEKLTEIIGKCRGKGPATNVSDKENQNGNKDPNKSSGDEVTQEQFGKMNVIEKSKLYREKPDLYNKLMANTKLR